MYSLKIISSTIRPGRKGPIVANWVADVAAEHKQFDTELIDLGEVSLPLMNEPRHPRLQQYEHEHTKKWSTKMDEADAFIFVTAEYSHSYPAPLKNALQYLSHEWAYKAAGIVSYGGVSAGTRASNDLKKDLATFKMVPLPGAVHIPFFTQFINDDDIIEPNKVMMDSARSMLDELALWTKGLKVIREEKQLASKT